MVRTLGVPFRAPPMPLRNTRLAATALLIGAAPLASCDSEPAGPDSVQFQGVTYVALGNADLRLRGGALEVNQVGSSGQDGVRVDAPDGALDTLNVSIQPLDFGAGAQWGITVYGDVGGVRTWSLEQSATNTNIVDCESTVKDVTSDVEAFVNGFATLTPLTDEGQVSTRAMKQFALVAKLY